MKIIKTSMLKIYLIKLLVRIIIFFSTFFVYLTHKEWLVEFMMQPMGMGITPLHVLWLIFMCMMIKHIFPVERLVTMALKKSEKKEYQEIRNYSELELHRFVKDMNVKAWMVMLVWLIFNSIFGALYVFKIIGEADLLMLTVFYFLCDLSRELIERYDVSIIPLHILLGDEEYEDGVGITPDEIFKWSDANTATPKTSACSLNTAMEVMKPYVDRKQEMICFAIASGMSTTMNVMRLAAEELDAEELVNVVDSANLSTGIGLLVLLAATMAKEGKCAKEILEVIDVKKEKVRASFVVDTLTYLHRGGRCSGVAALAGSVLKLHPKIEVVDGKMGANKNYRGKINSVIMNYVKDMEEMEQEMRTGYIRKYPCSFCH